MSSIEYCELAYSSCNFFILHLINELVVKCSYIIQCDIVIGIVIKHGCSLTIATTHSNLSESASIFLQIVDTAVTPFDPDSNFTMRALTLLEAAGIPVMSTLNNHTGTILCIQYSVLPSGLSSEQLFHYWLTWGGKLPPTWRSLLQIIRQLSLDELAYQVETYLRKHNPKGAERKTVMAVEGERIVGKIL